MEINKVLNTSVIRIERRKAWNTFILALVVACLCISSASGCIVAWGLRQALATTQIHEQELRDMRIESQKWANEARKCVDSTIGKKGQGFE